MSWEGKDLDSTFDAKNATQNMHGHNLPIIESVRTRLAGIKCKKIGGQAKATDYYPGCYRDPYRLAFGTSAHAWTAMKLNDEWYLSDVTWATGNVGALNSVLNLNTYVRPRTWNQ